MATKSVEIMFPLPIVLWAIRRNSTGITTKLQVTRVAGMMGLQVWSKLRCSIGLECWIGRGVDFPVMLNHVYSKGLDSTGLGFSD